MREAGLSDLIAEMKRLKTLRVVVFSFMVVMLEGFDIQAAGVAAPRLVPDFGLQPAQVGAFFSAAALGSLLFTALGGLLADRYGRKWVVIASTFLFGLACLLTPLAQNYEMLVAVRFLTGAGLGASLPPILAMVSDHSPVAHKKRWIGVVYSAISLGGMIVAGILAFRLLSGWRDIFYVGGIAPMIVAGLMAIGLPDTRGIVSAPANEAEVGWRDVIGPKTWAVTLSLWLAMLLTLSMLYLLVSWLPSLSRDKGLTGSDIFIVQMFFNLGATLSAFAAGFALDRKHVRAVPIIGYLALALGALLFATLPVRLVTGCLASFLLGAGVTTGQTFIYGFAPLCYPLGIRASGVGYALTAGRFGAMVGPFVAGMLLAYGLTAEQVLLLLAPTAIVALIIVFGLAVRFHAEIRPQPAGALRQQAT